MMSPRCYKNRHLHFFLCIWPLSFIASNHCIIALEWVLKVSFLVHKGYWVILEFKNPPTCVKQCPSLSDQKQFYTSTHAERNMKTMVGENMFRDFYFFFFPVSASTTSLWAIHWVDILLNTKRAKRWSKKVLLNNNREIIQGKKQ